MQIWWWLAQQTSTTALLILMATLICRLLPRRPALHHALWTVVLLKLLMPPLLAWPWSASEVWGLMPVPLASTVSQGQRTEDGDIENSPIESPDPQPDAGVPLARVASHPNAHGSEVNLPELGEVDPVVSANESDSRTIERSSPLVLSLLAREQPNIQQSLASTLELWFTAAWLLGAIVVAVRQARQIWVHWSLVSRASAPPENLTREVRQMAGLMGVRPVPALVADGIGSPFVWCLGRLKMVWPASLANQADLARLRGVIAHELAHVRRRDHWIAWLELFAAIVWWWNPLFWLVRRRIGESAEMACDVLVVNTLPEGRRAYAEALLEFSLPSYSAQPAPALGMSTSGRQSFERRLKMILSRNVTSKLSLSGMVLVGMLAVVAVPSWSQEKPEPEKSLNLLPPPAEGQSAQVAAEDVNLPGGPLGLLQELAESNAELQRAKVALAVAEKKLEATNRFYKLQQSKHDQLKQSQAYAPSAGHSTSTDSETHEGAIGPIEQGQKKKTLSMKFEGQADSESPAIAGTLASPDHFDTTNLGIAIIEARGAVRLAESKLSAVKKAAANRSGSITQAELSSAAISLDTAQQKLTFLTEIAETALQATREDLVDQQATVRHLDSLRKSDVVAKSHVMQAHRQLKALQAKLKVLESILKTPAPVGGTNPD